MCWIALQMAEQEMNRIWEELGRLEQDIQAKEQALLEGIKAGNMVIGQRELIEMGIHRLAAEKIVLLQVVGREGEVPYCCPTLTVAMTLSENCSVSRRKRLVQVWPQNVPSCAARLFLQQSPVQMPRTVMQLMLGFC